MPQGGGGEVVVGVIARWMIQPITKVQSESLWRCKPFQASPHRYKGITGSIGKRSDV